jgi:Peptidase MA superfamily
MRLAIDARHLLARALAAALAPALVALALAATPAAAATVAFEAPAASGTLGASITFSESFSAPAAPERVELLRAEASLGGDLVTEASVNALGSGRYQATVEETEHVLPNTTIAYHFRVSVGGVEASGPAATFTLQDTRYTWQVKSGEHMRLHWYLGDDAFAARAIAVGDAAVTKVSALLGVHETAPIDFFVYATKDGLDGALGPGTSEFVAGRAVPEIRTLFAQIGPSDINSDWVETVVPHELTHLVFDTATSNPYHEPPLWLNEGLAVYESEGYGEADRGRVSDAVRAGTLLPLTGLTGAFPQRQELFYLSYAEAVSAVDFFVRTYGQPKLVQLIKSYAGGVTDDEAFRAAAGVDVAGFQAAWLAALHAGPLPTYGPRVAADGPLPPGWSGTGASGGPLATTDASGTGNAGRPALGDGLDAVAGPLLVVAVVIAALLLVALLLFLRRRGGAGGMLP